MNADAVRVAKAWKHPDPKVDKRRSVHDLLESIAELIPEGDTMTSATGLKDLGARKGYNRRTMWEAHLVLVDANVIRVVGGGQGIAAAYELLLLAGAGAPPALPLRSSALIGEVRRVAKRPNDGPDLFSPGTSVTVLAPSDSEPSPANLGSEIPCTGSHSGSQITSWLSNLGSQITCWFLYVAYLGSQILSWPKHVISDHMLPLPLDVNDARARDVHTLTEVHTHTAAAGGAQDTGPPARAAEHPWHAWCDGPIHVPNYFHQDCLRKGHQAAWLFAFYARTCATVSPERLRTAVDEIKFWRTALAAELRETAAPSTRAPTRDPPDTAEPSVRSPHESPAHVWAQIQQVIANRVSRHDFHSWFVPTQLVEDHGATIEVAGLDVTNGDLVVDYIDRHYRDVVQQAAEQVRPGLRVEFVQWRIRRQRETFG